MARPRHAASLTVVIKLGSTSIIHEATRRPLLSTLSRVVEAVVDLRTQGHKVVIVSSGAIAVGLKRMDFPAKPKTLSGVQALAAVGQGRLIGMWDNLFNQLGQPIAQILLTRGDISDRTRYLNAVNTFKELLSMGVVPIVNENDTISVSEIKFGDNDTLSAITSSMIQADFLFLLSDVDGLYTSNPRNDPSAKLIQVVSSVETIRNQVNTVTLGSSLGTGGMRTKLIAAEIATGAGVTTIITSSSNPENISRILEHHRSSDGTPSRIAQDAVIPGVPHTMFLPSTSPLRDLKSWTAHTLYPAGGVVIDAGAHHVLSRRESGGRLLPAGVLEVRGAFASGQAVRILALRRSRGDDAATKSPSTEILTPQTSPIISAPDTSTSSFCVPTSPKDGSRNPSAQVADDRSAMDDAKRMTDEDIIEVGRGLANYNSEQIARVKGLNSSYISQHLGYADSEYVVENITIQAPATQS